MCPSARVSERSLCSKMILYLACVFQVFSFGFSSLTLQGFETLKILYCVKNFMEIQDKHKDCCFFSDYRSPVSFQWLQIWRKSQIIWYIFLQFMLHNTFLIQFKTYNWRFRNFFNCTTKYKVKKLSKCDLRTLVNACCKHN